MPLQNSHMCGKMDHHAQCAPMKTANTPPTQENGRKTTSWERVGHQICLHTRTVPNTHRGVRKLNVETTCKVCGGFHTRSSNIAVQNNVSLCGRGKNPIQRLTYECLLSTRCHESVSFILMGEGVHERAVLIRGLTKHSEGSAHFQPAVMQGMPLKHP